MWKGFWVGLVVANGFEWVAHKYILHGTHRSGKPRYSPVPDSMKSHWEHHREVRKTDFNDHGYVEGISNWRTKNEIISVVNKRFFRKSIPPFYFSHFEWSYNRNVQEINEYEYK